jgi:hypothetical protein
MNERIRQLADEAGFMEWFSESGDDCERELKKFAELIVRECIHALWTEECRINAMTQADYERSGNRIHKHFYGVEE